MLTTKRPPPTRSYWTSSPPSPFPSPLALQTPLHPTHLISSHLPFLLKSKAWPPHSYQMPFQMPSQRDFLFPNPRPLHFKGPTPQNLQRLLQALIAPLPTNLLAHSVCSSRDLTQLGESRKPGTRSVYALSTLKPTKSFCLTGIQERLRRSSVLPRARRKTRRKGGESFGGEQALCHSQR